jgi:hypothetical protein
METATLCISIACLLVLALTALNSLVLLALMLFRSPTTGPSAAEIAKELWPQLKRQAMVQGMDAPAQRRNGAVPNPARTPVAPDSQPAPE